MKNFLKKVISLLLASSLAFSFSAFWKTEALTPVGTVSDSYKKSTYYQNLCNVQLSGDQRVDIAEVAKSQIGYCESNSKYDLDGSDDGSYGNCTEYGNWFPKQNQAWCAVFVSWCAAQAGIPTSVIKKNSLATHDGKYFGVELKTFNNHTPEKGDIAYMKTPGNHVGIVYDTDDKFIYVIEGNTKGGSRVYKQKYNIKTGVLYGDDEKITHFGIPNYSSDIHKHSFLKTVSPATCTNHGYNNFTCSTCGYHYSEKYQNALGHNYKTFSHYESTHPHHAVYSCSRGCGATKVDTETSYNSLCEKCNPEVHKCSFSVYVGFEPSHPHYKIYKCSGCAKTETSKSHKDVPQENCSSCFPQKHSLTVTPGTNSKETVFKWNNTMYDDLAMGYPCKFEIQIFVGDYEFRNIFVEGNHLFGNTVSEGLLPGPYRARIIAYRYGNPNCYSVGDFVEFEVKYDEYNLYYDTNGGSGTFETQYGDGFNISTDEPYRYGYEFLGWSTSSASSRADYLPGSWIRLRSDTTLYAVWEKKVSFSILYNSLDGDITPESQTKFVNEPIKLSEQIPGKEGYIFKGWGIIPEQKFPPYQVESQSDAGIEIIDESLIELKYQPGDIYDENRHCRLYAVWEKDPNYVEEEKVEMHYCSDCDGTFSSTFIYYVHQLICKALSSDEAIEYRCGYCALIFYSKEELSKHIFNCESRSENKFFVNTCPYCNVAFECENEYNNHIQFCKNVYACRYCNREFISETVLAKHRDVCEYRFDEFILRFDVKGGSNSVPAMSGSNTYIIPSIKPQKNGCSFKGWSLNKAGTVVDYSPGDYINLTANTILYAVWEVKAIPDSPSVEYEISIQKPSQSEITYGDRIILHATIEFEMPAGYYIEWTTDNANFTIVETSDDGKTCTITPSVSGETTFTATVYDADGNAVGTDTQTMTAKAGFFQKIIAFFKKLFSLTKIIPEAFRTEVR